MIPFFNTAVTALRNTVIIKPARLAVTHILKYRFGSKLQ